MSRWFMCLAFVMGCEGRSEKNSDIVDVDGDGFDMLSDCDDYNAMINPSAQEACDGFDNDCDDLIDDEDDSLDPNSGTLVFADLDGDGFAGEVETATYCIIPEGWYLSALDCDDNNASVSPGLSESCDGVDNNCNGLVDDDDGNVTDGTPFYADMDGDGYGNPEFVTESCIQPERHVDNFEDCNDGNADINPAAIEICDGLDNDCDLLLDADDDSVDLNTVPLWYLDNDGDGFGDSTISLQVCTQPSGYVSDNTDCNDQQSSSYPLAIEQCDGVDNDCDGQIDDGLMVDWYLDNDGDGYGSSSTSLNACAQPSGYVSADSDCNDSEFGINPGVFEVCDGNIDNDCNGFADDLDSGLDLTSANTWYLDNDGDGDGDPNVTLTQCEMPPSYVLLGTDCDDGDSSLEGLDLDFDGFSTCDSDCDDDDDSVFACSECLDSNIGSDLGFGVSSGINTGSGNDFILSCGAIGEDLVYEWTAPQTGLYHFTANANYDVAVAIFDGCYGSELICADTSSLNTVDFQATAGETYTVVIDVATNSDVGNVSLDITTDNEVSCGDGIDEDNDGLTDCNDELDCWYSLDCANPTCPNYYLIDLQNFTPPQGDSVLTASLNGASDDLQGSCYSHSGGPDLSYDYESPQTGCAQISSVSDQVDVSMMVTAGCGGSELACNNDFPMIANLYGTAHAAYTEVDVVQGEIYIIGVDAPVGLDQGLFSINININTSVNCDGSPINR